MPRFQILPAETRFYDWFEKSAANLLDGARVLKDLMDHYERPALKVAQLTEIEHNGDFVVHEVIDLLHRTLVTPLDSEDTQALVSAIDDALDTLEQAATQMVIFEIEQPTDEARQFADIIVRCAEQVNQAMPLLREKGTLPTARQYAIEVNRLENEGDVVFRQALERLVATSRHDWFAFMSWKEIYEWLEDATDRFEDIADVLQTVVLKNA